MPEQVGYLFSRLGGEILLGGSHGIAEGMRGDGSAKPSGTLQIGEDLHRRVHPIFGSLQLDPMIAGGGSHSERGSENLQQTHVVGEEAVEKMGVLKLKGLLGHTVCDF